MLTYYAEFVPRRPLENKKKKEKSFVARFCEHCLCSGFSHPLPPFSTYSLLRNPVILRAIGLSYVMPTSSTVSCLLFLQLTPIRFEASTPACLIGHGLKFGAEVKCVAAIGGPACRCTCPTTVVRLWGGLKMSLWAQS